MSDWVIKYFPGLPDSDLFTNKYSVDLYFLDLRLNKYALLYWKGCIVLNMPN